MSAEPLPAGPAPLVDLTKPAAGPSSPPSWMPALDLGLRILGGLVAVLLAAVTAVYEAFYAPLRLGDWLAAASPLASVVINPALVWFAYVTTGRKLAALPPAVVWFAIMVVSAGRTTEGDLVFATNNWVGPATILVGSIAFGGAGYKLILARASSSR